MQTYHPSYSINAFPFFKDEKSEKILIHTLKCTTHFLWNLFLEWMKVKIRKIMKNFNSLFWGYIRNQCCGSGMFIPDPGSWFLPIPDPVSRISDPGSRIQKQQQKREVKKISSQIFLCSHKFNKIVNYFSFEVLKKKNLGQFSKNCWSFYPKIFNMLSNIWVWDPRSGIRKKPIPDPGSRGQKGTGSGSATLVSPCL